MKKFELSDGVIFDLTEIKIRTVKPESWGKDCGEWETYCSICVEGSEKEKVYKAFEGLFEDKKSIEDAKG